MNGSDIPYLNTSFINIIMLVYLFMDKVGIMGRRCKLKHIHILFSYSFNLQSKVLTPPTSKTILNSNMLNQGVAVLGSFFPSTSFVVESESFVLFCFSRIVSMFVVLSVSTLFFGISVSSSFQFQ